MPDRFRLRRNTSVQWLDLDPILESGEQGYEIDTKRFKIGDGRSKWTELDSFIPEPDILEAIRIAVANAGPASGSNDDALFVHINSPTPHPAYDDGPSFLLLYKNAKV